MKSMKKYIYFISILSALSFGSCSDYLDTAKELSANLTIDQVFENSTYTREWHNNIFNCITEYSGLGSSTNGGNGINCNPWSAMSGEIMQNNGAVKNLLESGYTAGNAQFHRWDTEYMYIRQAMIFLQKAKPIGNQGDVASLSEDNVNRMKAEARFFIAYCYFTMFELYGPVAIVPELADPENPNIDYPRASTDEMVNVIDSLLQDVINDPALPASIYKNGTFNYTEMTRPTKVVALALRAKLSVYAASPLLNGGFAEALTVKNKDGKRLFPDYDANKWVIAKQRLEELITFAEAQGHKLYYSADSDANKSVYELFQNYNDEILWATSVNERSTNVGDKRVTPRDMFASYGNIGVSQEVVDAFFMNNGLCIDDQGSGYKEDGFESVFNPASSIGRTDPNIFNMYANREARFYASVAYQGRSWHLQPNNSTNYAIGFAKGQAADNSSTDCPRGGYLLYKFYSHQVAFFTGTGIVDHYNKPSILFRLADFYLYYAEVCNEINPSDQNIIDYIDKIRTRAGISGYREMQDSGIKTNVIGNYQAQKEAIIHERYVELYAEGQRYFDMCRWMICEPGKSKYGDIRKFSGLNMNGYANLPLNDDNTFFKRVPIESRSAWSKKYYFYPIPQQEINKSKGALLVQNPLWEKAEE